MPSVDQQFLSERDLLDRIERGLQDFENVAVKPFEYRSVAQARAALDELRARNDRDKASDSRRA